MEASESQDTNASLPTSIEIPTIGEPWVEGTPFHTEVLQVCVNCSGPPVLLHMTRNYRNRQLTIEHIKPYLKAFNLGGLTLKREAMIHQLYQFSQDHDTWKTLVLSGSMKRHVILTVNTTTTGSRANQPSAKRVQDKFGDDKRLEQTTHTAIQHKTETMLMNGQMQRRCCWHE
ncbi:hypothetical protein EDD85DRAFT_785308 [Armillaria nabsnona]|nr:hypothetical protein EDD85DRAFT_785308 [Armillaria nabsnona]